MERFVSLPNVGDLYMGEVFNYYDGPKVFALNKKDSEEPIYLCYWIGDEEDSQSWVITPLTEDRINNYKNNEIDFLTFLNVFCEDDIYRLDCIFSSGEDVVNKMSKDEISFIAWPKEGLYFSK